MDHPLGEDTSVLSDEQLDQKITLLTKKFFQTRNPQTKSQLNLLLDMYKLEYKDDRKSTILFFSISNPFFMDLPSKLPPEILEKNLNILLSLVL